MSPEFLTLYEVLEIHRDQIERYGGEPGIRDLGLLKSAITMPSVGVGESYLHTDLFEMAAAYLFHIAQNHPFLDGNKRTGVVCALVFLELNGIKVFADEEALVEMVMAVAEGRIEKDAIAEFFRHNAKR